MLARAVIRNDECHFVVVLLSNSQRWRLQRDVMATKRTNVWFLLRVWCLVEFAIDFSLVEYVARSTELRLLHPSWLSTRMLRKSASVEQKRSSQCHFLRRWSFCIGQRYVRNFLSIGLQPGHAPPLPGDIEGMPQRLVIGVSSWFRTLFG